MERKLSKMLQISKIQKWKTFKHYFEVYQIRAETSAVYWVSIGSHAPNFVEQSDA